MSIVAPASRNNPCPCGSGRRYKECHGAIDALAGRMHAPRRSTYRAPGAEWARLDDAARDRLGATMEQALAMQKAGRLAEAARAYRDVIAVAPHTHDALHMLSVIEMGLGNPDEAKRLIVEAMALRPPHPSIQHNWLLVQDMLLLRARMHPEQLAEPALPILVDLALAPRVAERMGSATELPKTARHRTAVHLIGRAHAADHDDGWMLRRLADVLGVDDTTIWAVDGDGTEKIGGRCVRRVDGGIGAVPRGGTHVFVGVDFDCTEWIDRSSAERVIVFCQSAAPTRYLDQLRAMTLDGARPLELVFASQAMAERFGRGHCALPPPLDLAVTHAAHAPARFAQDERAEDGAPAWPIGIVGQNQQFVSDPADADFATTLASLSGRLHIYDPGRFRYLLGGSPLVRFFERRAGSLEPFLARLGCFVHRTDAWWQDTLGRELYGAMAFGVPVLCPRDSIHAERIEHGVDGFLYGSSAEAQQQMSDLRRDPEWAAAIGRAGRDRVRRLLDPETQIRRYRELVAGFPCATSGNA